MRPRSFKWLPLSLLGLVAALPWAPALVAACSGGKVGPEVSGGAAPSPADDGAYAGSFPLLPPSDDGGGEVTSRPQDSPALDDAGEQDAGSDASMQPAIDPPPDGACLQPLAAGALRIDELMIESVAGAGDDGEWVEIESTLDCAANLNGLHGECPRGAKVATFDVTGDLWIPPRGTFVVADSNDPAINHDLPGVVVVWFGHQGDVLRNKGSTITLSAGGTLLDTVTYPSLALAVGNSVAFPSDCDAGERTDFTKWKRSTASWFPGFFGTPNAPNTDVSCP
jgi:hypothetical protein